MWLNNMRDQILLYIEHQLDRLLHWLEKSQSIQGRNVYKTSLSVKQFRNGEVILERNLGGGVVTNAGVNLLAADWTNGVATLAASNWHDSGTGTTAPTVSDTIMQTPTGNARIQGAQSNASNVYQTVATLSYGTTFAITEWGLFTASSNGTMWDHRTFAAINCVAGDSIQFTYQLTVVS
jgi:hypothetical protein